MKNFRHKGIALLSILTIIGIGSVLAIVHAAGSATLSLQSSSSSHDLGTTFTVTVTENSPDQINAVQANLTYDNTKLEYVNIDASSSSFDFTLPSSGGGGTVKIARGVSGGKTLTGSQTVAKVTFKVLVGSGSSAVSFATDSAIVRPSDGQNVWDGNITGGTYTFTTPPSTTQTSSGSTAPTSTGTPKTSTTASATPTSTGTSPSASVQAVNPDTPIAVNSASVNSSGYLVAIKVKDQQGKSVSGATVTVDKKTTKSDATGVASFSGVSSGKHTVKISSAKGSVKGDFTVDGSKSAAEVQAFTFAVKPMNWILVYLGIGLVVAVLVAIIFTKYRGSHKNAYSHGTVADGGGPLLAGNGATSIDTEAAKNQEIEGALNKIHTDIPKPATVIQPQSTTSERSDKS